jgi:hypothetical protein
MHCMGIMNAKTDATYGNHRVSNSMGKCCCQSSDAPSSSKKKNSTSTALRVHYKYAVYCGTYMEHKSTGKLQSP